MNFFISNAYAQGGGQPQGSPMVSLIFMLGLFVFFWLIIIRPQRKRQKEHEQLVANLSKGDEVVMTSGLLGKVTKIEGDYLVVQAADGIDLKFQRVAVHAVLPKGTLKAI
ncbi:MAG: preprotein translocase subunit YajC [Pseudomonadales bacterium]|nr:preprotein translocase subunit YajC [Gammaproteobacteria bacterium]NNL57826.1 preprotein translocase subunit YajC [Pseudomonadales bacterium]